MCQALAIGSSIKFNGEEMRLLSCAGNVQKT